MPEITVPADAVFPILKDNILVDGFHVVIDLEKSRGSVIVDALEGKEYLDCYCYFATLPIGHNHPKLEDEGFRKSLMIAALSNPANSDMYSKEFAAFVKTFRDLAVPDEFEHLFFVAGGALAVENAMKAAFDWKAQKNRAKGIEGGADKIMHFRDAFHGRSGYTLSVTNTDPTKTRDFPKFDWPRISSPAIEFPVDESKIAAAESQAEKEIETAFADDPHGIAAILIEPIQCEGGDHYFRPEFMRKLREYADEYDRKNAQLDELAGVAADVLQSHGHRASGTLPAQHIKMSVSSSAYVGGDASNDPTSPGEALLKDGTGSASNRWIEDAAGTANLRWHNWHSSINGQTRTAIYIGGSLRSISMFEELKAPPKGWTTPWLIGVGSGSPANAYNKYWDTTESMWHTYHSGVAVRARFSTMCVDFDGSSGGSFVLSDRLPSAHTISGEFAPFKYRIRANEGGAWGRMGEIYDFWNEANQADGTSYPSDPGTQVHIGDHWVLPSDGVTTFLTS